MTDTANAAVADRHPGRAGRLLQILDLESVELNLFLGRNEVRGEFRLFGGQVLAQALRAACHTVDERHVHSLHGYFLRAGNASLPVLYEVDRIRDGRSFTTRRVVAVQEGRAIFNMSASFQVEEPGFEHAQPMPNVPLPDELDDDITVAKRLQRDDPRLSPMAARERPFEMRSVFPLGSDAWAEQRYWNPVWVRFRKPATEQHRGGDPTPVERSPAVGVQGAPAAIPAGLQAAGKQHDIAADQVLARCLLAYASDMGLVSTASLPHQHALPRGHLQMASLDHALWVHRDVPLDGWLLFHKRTPSASGARGLVHAEFFSEQGGLVASVTQEGLMRPPRGHVA